jgi:site-specific DNA-methyltransferase (adenine-specific)
MKDNYLLLLGKSEEVLKSLKDNSVDSIVTDPPYELGFMGKKWDNTGIAYNVDIWKECLRVLKPGGHLLSFGGTRTSHRMVCAIEDAGFEIRDTIMWIHGSGFPKSLNVSKAIDKAAGVEFSAKPASGVGFMGPDGPGGYNVTRNQLTREGESTAAAREWSGWGTALKPAHEPITVARKPFEGTVAQNVLEHGTGGLNIDACRVIATGERLGGGGEKKATFAGKEGWGRPWMKNQEHVYSHCQKIKYNVEKASDLGRWPANVIHDGSKEVIDLFPKSSSPQETTNCGKFKTPPGAGGTMGTGWYGDRSAARYFYCAKASKTDRDEGCEDLPEQNVSYMNTHGGDADKGDTWHPIDDRTGETRDRFQATMKNTHPTVKPTELMKYLVRLVTQLKGTILDPFCGSGSTGKAAIIEGFKFIGIDSDPTAIDIAKRRIHNVSRKRLRVDIWDNILS